MDKTLYHISNSGIVTGPFTADQLRNMWAVGSIQADAYCLAVGSSDWTPLAAMAALTAPLSAPVTMQGIDPFAHLHTPIKGRAEGKLSVIGWLGIGIGVLCLPLMLVNGGAVFGVGMGVACYFWARKPVA